MGWKEYLAPSILRLVLAALLFSVIVPAITYDTGTACVNAPCPPTSAVGTPFIALFGPTDAGRHLPPGKNYVVINKELRCSPCYKTKCRSKSCMMQISPAEVFAAVMKLFK